MTKWILHGGRDGPSPQDDKKFFGECVRGLAEPIHVLCVYFARTKDKWPELFEQDKINFSSNLAKKQVKMILAEDKKDVFIKQIRSADVIYLRGGSEQHMYEFLKTIDNLKRLLTGKVIAGSSMGAYVISKYCHDPNYDSIQNGLGLLPIKVFGHYKNETNKLDALKKHKENLEVYALPEHKFVVIYD